MYVKKKRVNASCLWTTAGILWTVLTKKFPIKNMFIISTKGIRKSRRSSQTLKTSKDIVRCVFNKQDKHTTQELHQCHSERVVHLPATVIPGVFSRFRGILWALFPVVVPGLPTICTGVLLHGGAAESRVTAESLPEILLMTSAILSTTGIFALITFLIWGTRTKTTTSFSFN